MVDSGIDVFLPCIINILWSGGALSTYLLKFIPLFWGVSLVFNGQTINRGKGWGGERPSYYGKNFFDPVKNILAATRVRIIIGLKFGQTT